MLGDWPIIVMPAPRRDLFWSAEEISRRKAHRNGAMSLLDYIFKGITIKENVKL